MVSQIKNILNVKGSFGQGTFEYLLMFAVVIVIIIAAARTSIRPMISGNANNIAENIKAALNTNKNQSIP